MIEEAIAAARQLKQAGNAHFSREDALAAVDDYRRAISTLNKAIDPSVPEISEGATVLVTAGAGGPARSAMIMTVDDGVVEVLYDDNEEEEANVDVSRLRGVSEAPAERDALRGILLLNTARCYLKLEQFSNAVMFATDAFSLVAADRKSASLVVRGKVGGDTVWVLSRAHVRRLTPPLRPGLPRHEDWCARQI